MRALLNTFLLASFATVSCQLFGLSLSVCKNDYEELCGDGEFTKKNMMTCFADKKDKLSSECGKHYQTLIGGKLGGAKSADAKTKPSKVQDLKTKAATQKQKANDKADKLLEKVDMGH